MMRAQLSRRPNPSRRLSLALLSFGALLAPTTHGAQPPPPPSAPAPAPTKGYRVILVEHHGLPFVNLSLYFGGGPAFDPPGKEGLTALTNRMLLRGTERYPRAALEEAIEALGTELSTSTQGYAVGVGGAVLTRNLPQLAELLTEILGRPTFAPDELDKVRREMIAEYETAKDDDGALVRRWFRRLVFADHPFGHGAAGNPSSLARITRDDVVRHFRETYTRNNLVIGASGDIDEAALTGLLEPTLSALPAGEPAQWDFPPPGQTTGRRVALIDKADRTQAQILVGHPSVPAADPDFLALHLATTAFGGTFTARLMQEVRVKRGLSYGAYARLSAERAGGSYALTAAPESHDAISTTALLLSEYERFVSEGLTDAEIEFARGYLINSHPFSLETPALRAAQIVRARLLGQPDDWLETLIAQLATLSPDAVRDAVRRRLDPANLTIVVVCSAPALRDGFAALPGVTQVTVHPYDLE